jgi:hypothetical protein
MKKPETDALEYLLQERSAFLFPEEKAQLKALLEYVKNKPKREVGP